MDTIRAVNADNKSCSPGYSLSNDLLCYNELSTFHLKCTSISQDELIVSIDTNLEWQQSLRLFNQYGLEYIIQPSPQCELLFKHLHCLLGYGVCDGNRIELLSRESCVAIRDHLCVREWRAYSQFSGQRTFLNCEELLPSTDQCEGTLIIEDYVSYKIVSIWMRSQQP